MFQSKVITAVALVALLAVLSVNVEAQSITPTDYQLATGMANLNATKVS